MASKLMNLHNEQWNTGRQWWQKCPTMWEFWLRYEAFPKPLIWNTTILTSLSLPPLTMFVNWTWCSNQFVRAPRWVLLYLPKSTEVCGIPKIVGMTICLNIFLVVMACSRQPEIMFGGVYGYERKSTHVRWKVICLYVISQVMIYLLTC